MSAAVLPTTFNSPAPAPRRLYRRRNAVPSLSTNENAPNGNTTEQRPPCAMFERKRRNAVCGAMYFEEPKSPRTSQNGSPRNKTASPSSPASLRRHVLSASYRLPVKLNNASNCLMPDLPSPTVDDALARWSASSWHFCALSVPQESLVDVVVAMFYDLGLFQKFQIPHSVFRAYVNAVHDGYLDNPYHNFQHAVDVTQACYMLLKQSNAQRLLRPLDTLAVMCAALCHDLGHPGTNNAFQKNSNSDLAAKYSVGSILEQHHFAQFSTLIQTLSSNIFFSLKDTELTEVMELIKEIILATDMLHHASLVASLVARLELAAPLSLSDKKDRQLVLMLLMKASDISNVVRPHATARQWTQVLRDEFLAQLAQEKALGLPVTIPPSASSPKGLAAGFIDFCAQPLFSVLVRVFPELHHLLAHLRFNRSADVDFAPSACISTLTAAAAAVDDSCLPSRVSRVPLEQRLSATW